MKEKCFFLLLVVIFFGCDPDSPPSFPEGDVQGYKPVYGDSIQAHSIVTEDARELINPGKIYTYGNLLLVNERNEGVHVINNTDPSNPDPLYFIKVPGNVDVAMKNNVIYADNYNDLVLIRVNSTGIENVKRIRNALQMKYYEVPPTSGYFECVDYSKGFIVGWEQATLNSPKCYH